MSAGRRAALPPKGFRPNAHHNGELIVRFVPENRREANKEFDFSRLPVSPDLQDATESITGFVSWVNHYCQEHALPDEVIPCDPLGPLALSRFRRTLAWHIVRRPRGLVAAAIQYGHLNVRITLGYAGAYNSGFPDDYAFEGWLYQIEQLADRHDRLTAGEHISGPPPPLIANASTPPTTPSPAAS